MCVCVMSRPRPGKNKKRHVDCYESSSPGSSGSNSPVAARRLAQAAGRSTVSTAGPIDVQSAVNSRLMNGVRATRQIRSRVGSSGGSGADSPRSLDTPRLRPGSALSSPLRSSRQGTSSPGEDLSDDSGIRMQKGTYQSMYQDVINIKALLLRLSRVVQEQSESESHVEASQKLQNGFHPTTGDSQVERKAEQEMIADLQRQIVFLHSQVEEKERKIRTLQSQTLHPPEPCGHVETCNAATQTERLRPLSTGPILSTQSDSTGASFVSNTNESTRAQPQPNSRAMSRLPQWRRPPSPLPSEQHKMSLLSMPTFRKQT